MAKNRIFDFLSSFLFPSSSCTAGPAYSYIVYSRFLAIVELNLIPFAFISLLFYPCYSRLLLQQTNFFAPMESTIGGLCCTSFSVFFFLQSTVSASFPDDQLTYWQNDFIHTIKIIKEMVSNCIKMLMLCQMASECHQLKTRCNVRELFI